MVLATPACYTRTGFALKQRRCNRLLLLTKRLPWDFALRTGITPPDMSLISCAGTVLAVRDPVSQSEWLSGYRWPHRHAPGDTPNLFVNRRLKCARFANLERYQPRKFVPSAMHDQAPCKGMHAGLRAKSFLNDVWYVDARARGQRFLHGFNSATAETQNLRSEASFSSMLSQRSDVAHSRKMDCITVQRSGFMPGHVLDKMRIYSYCR